MNSIFNLTPRELRKAASIQERIASLQKELTRLLGGGTPAASDTAPRRRKMSAAARARWAKIKRSKPAKAGKRGRRRMSAAAKARLATIARARWAKARAAGRSAL